MKNFSQHLFERFLVLQSIRKAQPRCLALRLNPRNGLRNFDQKGLRIGIEYTKQWALGLASAEVPIFRPIPVAKNRNNGCAKYLAAYELVFGRVLRLYGEVYEEDGGFDNSFADWDLLGFKNLVQAGQMSVDFVSEIACIHDF